MLLPFRAALALMHFFSLLQHVVKKFCSCIPTGEHCIVLYCSGIMKDKSNLSDIYVLIYIYRGPNIYLQIPEGWVSGGWGQALFSSAQQQDRGNGHKLKQRKFQLKMRKNFFPLRVTEHWHRLPREAVESPALEIFQPRLDKVLCSLL